MIVISAPYLTVAEMKSLVLCSISELAKAWVELASFYVVWTGQLSNIAIQNTVGEILRFFEIPII